MGNNLLNRYEEQIMRTLNFNSDFQTNDEYQDTVTHWLELSNGYSDVDNLSPEQLEDFLDTLADLH